MPDPKPPPPSSTAGPANPAAPPPELVDPTKVTWYCTVVPDAAARWKPGYLMASILITPIIREDAKAVPPPFDNWPCWTGLPFLRSPEVGSGPELSATSSPPKPGTVNVTVCYRTKGQPEVQAEGFVALEGFQSLFKDETLVIPDDFDPGATFLETQKYSAAGAGRWEKVKSQQRQAIAFWEQLFGDCSVAGVPANTEGATPKPGANVLGGEKAEVYQPAPENAEKASEISRQGLSTVGGIGTSDVIRTIALPLLLRQAGHAESPEAAADYAQKLREYGFALARQDRVGSAGRAQTRNAGKAQTETADARGSADSKAPEFHESISAIGDDRPLMRLLGLVFSVKIPIPPGFPVENSFDLRAEMTVTSADGKTVWSSVPGGSPSTPCIVQQHEKTLRCLVDCDREGEDELITGGFLRQDLLDTVQFDVISLLRSAIREEQEMEKARKETDGTKPHALPLTGHGITIFRKAGAQFFNRTASILNNTGANAPEDGKAWRASDLVRGFVIDVHGIPPWSPENGKREWRRLCHRDVCYSFGEGKNKVEFKARSDETCLGFATTEGASPLSGWLLGRLASLDTATKPSQALRLKLTAERYRFLDYPQNLPERLIDCYLLSMATGLIVVADVPAIDDLSEGPQEQEDFVRGPIGRRIQIAHKHEGAFLGATWFDLTGTVASEQTFFFATDANAAGPLEGIAGVATIVGDETETTLVRMLVQRFMDLPNSTAPVIEKAPAYFQFDANGSAKLRQWHKENAAKAPFFFQGRGLGVIALRDLLDVNLDALKRGPELAFAERIDDVRLQFDPLVDGERPPGAHRVTIELAPGAKIVSITQSNLAVADLRVGQRFRVTFASADFKAPDLKVIRMVEETAARQAKIESVQRDNAPAAKDWGTVRLRFGAETATPFIIAREALVEFFDDVPAIEAEAGVAGDGDEISAGESDGQSTARGTTRQAKHLRGPWTEHGVRLAPGDVCEVDFAPAREGGDPEQLRISRLRVVARDPASCVIGRFSTMPANSKNREEREDLFFFKPLPMATSNPEQTDPPEMQVIIEDSTQMVATPPFAGAQWRLPQVPPEGALTRLFHESSSEPGRVHARRVELLNSLHGTIEKVSVPDDPEAPLKLHLRLLGTKDASVFTIPRVDPKGVLLHRVLMRGMEVEVLVTPRNDIGEVRWRLRGFWRAEHGAKFLHEIGSERTVPVKLDQKQLTSAPGEVAIENELFDFGLSFSVAAGALDGKRPAIIAYSLGRPPTGIVTQLISLEQPLAGPKTARSAEALVIGQTFRALPTAAERPIGLFMEPELAAFLPLAEKLVETRVPVSLKVVRGVLFDERTNRPASAPKALEQQWDLFAWDRTNANDRTLQRILESDMAVRPLLAAEIQQKPSAWYSSGSGAQTQFDPLRVVALGDEPGGEKVMLAPPAVLTGGWTEFEAKVPDKPTSAAPLLPDQVVVEDALVHWFGSSLAKSDERRAAFINHGDDHESAHQKLRIEVRVPENSPITPLRVGWKYKFRLRAVWVTGDPVPFSFTADEKQAVLTFRPLGADDKQNLDSFLRTEPFAPPRIGWPVDLLPKEHSKPHYTRHVTTTEISQQKALFKELKSVPPRLAQPYTFPFAIENGWGDPLDTHLRSDPAQLMHRECDPKKDPKDPKKLPWLPQEPEILISPASLTVNEAERYGLIERWRKIHGKGPEETYWELLWAYDEIECSDAWWLFHKNYYEKNPKDYPFVYQQRRACLPSWDPKKPGDDPPHPPSPTQGRVLHRLPDYGAARLAVTVIPLLQPPMNAGDKETSDFNFVLCEEWPGVQEIRAALSRQQRPDGKAVAWDTKARVLRFHLPRDADWRVSLRVIPEPEVCKNHLLCRLMPRGEQPGDLSLTPAELGSELAPEVFLRLRHCTNKPLQRPRKYWLRLGPRVAGDTLARYDAAYLIDRPSTGALLIQAAREMDYVDDPSAPLPRIPAIEMSRIIAVEKETGASAPVRIALPSNVWGHSSDRMRTLSTAEFGVTELIPEKKYIEPTGTFEEKIAFRHELPNTKHHTVFYRAIALSRWREFYCEREVATNPALGPYPSAQTNPECASEKDEEKETWHRVEVPATVRPSPPKIWRARVSFGWDPQWSGDGKWTGGGRSWTFTRTRMPGCRIWLERPWYSSGSGEKLGILCWANTRVGRDEKDRYLGVVSRWGADPKCETQPNAKVGLLTRAAFLSAEPDSPLGVVVPPEPAEGSQPVRDAVKSAKGLDTSDNIRADLRVGLAVHTPRFHIGERRWFCDVFIKPQRYTPFVWLSVARYQSHAIPGAEISRPVPVPHPVQLFPQRTLTITAREEAGSVRILVQVSGLVSAVVPRRIVAGLERLVTNSEFVADDPIEGQPRAASPLLTAADLPALGPGGEIWQTLPCIDQNGTQAGRIELACANGNKGVFRGELLLPKRRDPPTPERIRVFVSEAEIIPAAWLQLEGGHIVDSPHYLDYAELPSETIK